MCIVALSMIAGHDWIVRNHFNLALVMRGEHIQAEQVSNLCRIGDDKDWYPLADAN